MDRIARQGMARAKDFGTIGLVALSEPAFIYEGIRKSEDGWLCYAVRPTFAHHDPDGAPGQPWANELYAMFVSADREIYNGVWIVRDAAGLPVDHAERFGRRLY